MNISHIINAKLSLALVLLTVSLSAICVAENTTTRFMIVGDTAYNPPADYDRYHALIAKINAVDPDFTIHIGDTKGGGSCGDDFQKQALEFLNEFSSPVIYTPGDNEWTDCHRPINGSFKPEERLYAIRRIFFASNQSL